MGSYDDNSGNSPIPGGSLAKPVMIALGALLTGKLLKGNGDDAPATQAQPVPEQPQAGGGLLGGILGGLGGLRQCCGGQCFGCARTRTARRRSWGPSFTS